MQYQHLAIKGKIQTPKSKKKTETKTTKRLIKKESTERPLT